MSRPDPTNYTTPIRIIQLEPILRSLFYFIYLIVRGRVSSAVRCTTSSAPFHSQGRHHPPLPVTSSSLAMIIIINQFLCRHRRAGNSVPQWLSTVIRDKRKVVCAVQVYRVCAAVISGQEDSSNKKIWKSGVSCVNTIFKILSQCL